MRGELGVAELAFEDVREKIVAREIRVSFSFLNLFHGESAVHGIDAGVFLGHHEGTEDLENRNTLKESGENLDEISFDDYGGPEMRLRVLYGVK